MITIKNRLIPFKGYKAVNLFGILFVRSECFPLDAVDERHEEIHTKQMREMLYVGFYLWYLAEWLVRLLICRDFKKAYRNISFEQEARYGEGCRYYLDVRRRWSWFTFLIKNKN